MLDGRRPQGERNGSTNDFDWWNVNYCIAGPAGREGGGATVTDALVPGEVRTADGAVRINEGRETAEVTVANTGDRPVQVGSHLHFVEANAALAFDRAAAVGMRLNIPAGTAVRFEPGETEAVSLVAIGGERHVYGINGLTNGTVEGGDAVVERARERGFAMADEAATADATATADDAPIDDAPGDGEDS